MGWTRGKGSYHSGQALEVPGLPRGAVNQPNKVLEVFGQSSQAHGMNLGDGPVEGQEWDSKIFVGPFQLSVFCNSDQY